MKKIAFIFAAVLAVSLCGADQDEPKSLSGVVTMMRSLDLGNYMFVRTDDGEDWRISMDGSGEARRRFRTGDLVTIDGALEPLRNRHTRRLFLAKVEVTGHDEAKVPEHKRIAIRRLHEKPANDIVPDWFARPVIVRGRVHNFWRRTNLLSIVLERDGLFVACQIGTPINVPTPELFDDNALVEVRGIAVFSAVWDAEHNLAGFDNITILSDGMDSLEVLSKPPFWTPAKIWLVSAFTFLSLLAAFGWGAAMSAKVRREQHAATAIAAERKRMAIDLHDTIEQHLAGVKMLLSAAIKGGGVTGPSKTLLERAADMLVHAKNEVRNAVMDLRNEEETPRSLEIRLKELAASMEVSGEVAVKTRLRGLDKPLDLQAQNDIVLIVREAIANAIKHGNAKTIAFVSDPVAAVGDGKAGFSLRILNDGAFFDPATAPGAATGHYGLEGMRQRAAKHGFKLCFDHDEKWMEVRIEVC